MLDASPNIFTGIIRIVKTPDGDAPESVRRAWVGLELPCLPRTSFSDGHGVLNQNVQPPRWCFVVPQFQALQQVALQDSIAAQWWTDNGYPESKPYACFTFEVDEAEILNNSVQQGAIQELTDEMQGASDR